jgi:SAM-dependent methyltransferase
VSTSRIQSAIGAVYSWAANRVYEPLVVRGTFRLLGRNLHANVAEQGRRAVAVAGGTPILDVPIGTGYFTLAYAQHARAVVGVDYAAGMVATARTRTAGANVVLVRGDIHRLPFRTGSYRAIMCTNGLQVIPGTAPALRELARVLHPEGTLFVSIVSAPLDRFVPLAAGRLPAILMSGGAVADALGRAGLAVTSLRRDRFCSLVEARHSQN